MPQINMRGATPQGEPLCNSCRWASRLRGFSESQEVIRCGYLNGRQIPFRIFECPNYTAHGSLNLNEMDSIAWVLTRDKNSGRIGFKSAEELRKLGDFSQTPAQPTKWP